MRPTISQLDFNKHTGLHNLHEDTFNPEAFKFLNVSTEDLY